MCTHAHTHTQTHTHSHGRYVGTSGRTRSYRFSIDPRWRYPRTCVPAAAVPPGPRCTAARRDNICRRCRGSRAFLTTASVTQSCTHCMYVCMYMYIQMYVYMYVFMYVCMRALYFIWYNTRTHSHTIIACSVVRPHSPRQSVFSFDILIYAYK